MPKRNGRHSISLSASHFATDFPTAGSARGKVRQRVLVLGTYWVCSRRVVARVPVRATGGLARLLHSTVQGGFATARVMQGRD